jgi:fructose-1,6-bisphosphatase II
MDRNLALEFVRVTEAAAIAAAGWIGRGDKKAADQAAVDAMRSRLNQIDFKGRVVISEGEKDEAAFLSPKEDFGKGNSPVLDIAVDPLECTDSVAHGRYNALAVIVSGEKGSLLAAPDTYMEKIIAGPDAKKVIDLDAPVKENILKAAKALGKDIREMTVIVLDRPRHEQLISDIIKAGARVRLITDGDVAGAIAPSLPEPEVDLLIGTGGSTEAVLAAVAVKILGGEMFCRFKPRNEKDRKTLDELGINLKTIFSTNDLAKGKKLTFTATGVIDGPLLQGVRFGRNHILTHSLAIRGISGTIRYITTYHHEHELKR